MRARSGVPPTRLRASSPSRHAPAVCEDDGPTITGPMMSSRETTLSRFAPARRWLEQVAQVATRMRGIDASDLLRRTGGDDRSAARAAFGAEVDDPVRR